MFQGINWRFFYAKLTTVLEGSRSGRCWHTEKKKTSSYYELDFFLYLFVSSCSSALSMRSEITIIRSFQLTSLAQLFGQLKRQHKRQHKHVSRVFGETAIVLKIIFQYPRVDLMEENGIILLNRGDWTWIVVVSLVYYQN